MIVIASVLLEASNGKSIIGDLLKILHVGLNNL